MMNNETLAKMFPLQGATSMPGLLVRGGSWMNWRKGDEGGEEEDGLYKLQNPYYMSFG
jgi:hypothetical protein